VRGRPCLLLTAEIALAAFFALGSLANAQDATGTAPAPSTTISPAEHAEALVERLRRGSPASRDEAVRELLELAEAEDRRPGADHSVHDVLRRALLDGDAEVRFRARRIISDPEVRVERLLVKLLEPQQLEAALEIRRNLLEGPDRAVARAGLHRIARRAAEAGFDPLTSKQQETWHPWGLEDGARLRQVRRFHVAVDLLGEMTSDDEIAPLCDLLHEDLGTSLGDVIDGLAARPVAARAWLRSALGDPRPLARENAAWALGELGTAEDAPALLAALADTEPRVRRAAVTAFGMLPVDPAVCVPAGAHANDPDPSVAAAALNLGATLGLRFVCDPARRILGERTTPTPGGGADVGPFPPETRVAAMKALACLGDTSGQLREVASRTGSGDDDFTKFAAWAAGTSGDQEALGTLETLLGREELALEPGIFYGIARSGALAWLDRLAHSPHAETRRLALQAHGSAKGDATQIAEFLQDAATRAIDREAGSDWNDFLTAYRTLRDRDDEPSRKAIGVLLDVAIANSSRGTGVDDQTLSLLIDYAEQARATPAVRGLVTILKNNNRHPISRPFAIQALATLDARRAREVLGSMLETAPGNQEIVEALARNLARAGDPSHKQRAVEIARQKVARSVAGSEAGQFISNLNSEGIDHAYAAEVNDAVLCFRRMRWIEPDSNEASYNIACVLALSGDKENAIRWLRRSIVEGFKNWRHIRGDADLTSLYDDPRFLRIIDQLRMEQEIVPRAENN
jgi:HEAT repeat protein